MASNSEIEKEDIISKDALEAPLHLIDNLQLLIESFDEVIEAGKKQKVAIDATDSIKKLEKEINKLITDNNRLTKSQKDLFNSVDKLEKENKKLADEMKRLQQESRKSKEQMDKLSDSMEALDNRVGGQITRWKQLGKELMAIAKHPIVLILAVIIGLLAAATNAVKTFWTATGEGEDEAARQSAVWKQFFTVFKKEWASLGKALSDSMGGTNGTITFINGIFEAAKFVFPFLIVWLNKVQAEFNKTAKEASDLADAMDELSGKIANNLIEQAKVEAEINRLTTEIGNQQEVSDVGRIVRLQKILDLRKQHLKTELDIAKQNAAIVLYSIGLEHGLTKAVVDRMTFQQMDAEFKGEEMKRIAEAQAKVIELEGQYFLDIKKNTAAISKAKEEMYQKEVEAAKKAAAEIAQLAKDAAEGRAKQRDEQIAQVQREVVEELKNQRLGWRERKEIVKNADEDIAELRKKARIQDLEDQIKTLEKAQQLLGFDAEAQKKVAEEIAALKIKLADEVYNQQTVVGKAQIDKDIENLNKLRDYYDSFASNIGDLFHTLTENRLEDIDRQEQRLQDSLDTQLDAVGDNEEKKREIENETARKQLELERKRIKEQRKAAIFDKAVSIIQALINGALAVTNQLAKGDPYTAFARAAAAGVLAAIQVAAIASKQIPQYFRGGKTKQRIISVGEKGFEHFKTPSGVEGFTPDSATVVDYPVGTVITDHENTLAKIANRSIRPERLGTKKDMEFLKEFGEKIDNLNHTIENKPVVEVNYTSRGVEGLLIKAMKRIKFSGQFYR